MLAYSMSSAGGPTTLEPNERLKLIGAANLVSQASTGFQGHDFLVRITGRDFGYDLQAWHDYLKESREGGYTYGRNILLPRIMQAVLH